jgi:hypothetical protein
MTGPGWTPPEGWGPPPPAGAGQQTGYGPPPGAGPQPAYGQPSLRPYGQPDLKPGVVPLRPLGLGEMLDGAVGVMRRYPRPTLGMSAAVAVVMALLNVVLLLTVLRPLATFDPTTPLTGDTEQLQSLLGGAAVGGLLSGLLALLAGAVLTGILTAVVGKAVLGQPLDVRQAWETVRPQLWKLVAVSVLIALGVVVVALVTALVVGGVVAAGGAGPGAVLLAVPIGLAGVLAAVYVAVRLSLAPCALVLERVGVGDSLRRSWALVKGDWWRVFGITALTLVIAAFVSVLVQAPFELFGSGGFAGLTGGGDALAARTLIASSIGAIVASTLIDPFTAGVRALLYVDRRMRAEGLDVALAAAATGRP